jgi:CheY-like chemotaxis protein
MKQNEFIYDPLLHLHIMLADGNRHEHFFFDKVLKTLSHQIKLTTVEDGQSLMTHLLKNAQGLPDVLILDYNIPLKNGFECLVEIKESPELKELPVIIYSSDLHEDVADLLYEGGAHFHIIKTDFTELKKILHHIFLLIVENKFTRPSRDQFLLISLKTEDNLNGMEV